MAFPYLTLPLGWALGRLLHLGYEAKIGINAKNSPVS